MHRAGVIMVWVALFLTVTGLVAGFGGIALGYDDAGIWWLGLIPIGFALLLAGVVMTQLSRKD